MTRLEFISLHRHELGGMVLDAVTTRRTGADLSLHVRGLMEKIDSLLGAFYDSLQPAIVPQINGQQKPNLGKVAR